MGKVEKSETNAKGKFTSTEWTDVVKANIKLMEENRLLLGRVEQYEGMCRSWAKDKKDLEGVIKGLKVEVVNAHLELGELKGSSDV